MEEKKKRMYTLTLSERQLALLSEACENYSRLICGQDHTLQRLLERAWEKRSKEETGNAFDKSFEGGWPMMRREAEETCRHIKRRFWGIDGTALNGSGYDDESDILFDIHDVLRHRIWLDSDADGQMRWSVASGKPMQTGSEPLCEVWPLDEKGGED